MSRSVKHSINSMTPPAIFVYSVIGIAIGISIVGGGSSFILWPARFITVIIGGLLILGLAIPLSRHSFRLFLLLVFAIPWETPFALQSGGLTIMPLLGAYVVLIWLIGIFEGRYHIRLFGGWWLLLSFWVMVILAAVISEHPMEERGVILTYTQLVGLVFLTVSMVRDQVRLNKALWVYTISVTLVSIISLIQFSCVEEVIISQGFLRAHGVTAASPRLAFYTATATLFLIATWGQIDRHRLWRGLAVLLNLAALVTTLSVTVIFGFVVAFLFWLLISGNHRVRLGWRGLFRVAVLGVLFVGLLQLGPIKKMDIVQRTSNRYEQIRQHTIYRWGSGRGATWMSTFNVIAANPWWGVGEKQYTRALPASIYWVDAEIFRDSIEKGSHNLFLSVAAGEGIIALGILLGFLVSVYLSLFKSVSKLSSVGQKMPALISIGKGLISWWILASIVAMGLDYQRHKVFWLFLALSICYSQIVRQYLGAMPDSKKIDAES